MTASWLAQSRSHKSKVGLYAQGICENVECRAVLARGQVKSSRENDGWYFPCPDCKFRNELKDIGLPGAPLQLIQPEISGLPHKVIATARPLEGGRYAAQLRVQREPAIKGTYAVEEHWEQPGVFLDAKEAVAHANAFAADLQKA